MNLPSKKRCRGGSSDVGREKLVLATTILLAAGLVGQQAAVVHARRNVPRQDYQDPQRGEVLPMQPLADTTPERAFTLKDRGAFAGYDVAPPPADLLIAAEWRDDHGGPSIQEAATGEAKPGAAHGAQRPPGVVKGRRVLAHEAKKKKGKNRKTKSKKSRKAKEDTRREASESATYYSDSNDAQSEGSGFDGDHPPPNRECPYVIQTEDEALARARNESIPGNIVKVEHLRFCRTGNHFSTVFRNLALGYCCKSKVVWLPPKDDILAPGIFNEGTPGPRWFDFSGAPDVDGFNSTSCKAHITWAGPRAFRMNQLDDPEHHHYNPLLRECIGRVPRLLGCEAAYYFPTDVDVCTAGDEHAAGIAEKDHGKASEAGAEAGARRLIKTTTAETLDVVAVGGSGGSTGVGAASDSRDTKRQAAASGDGQGAGNLVLHVRSGDIFDEDVLPYYGQPPLQYYLHVIGDQKWDRIDVVTNGVAGTLNPVVPALQAKKDSGELSTNVHIHTDRSMEEDLRSMMCADALAVARSTLVGLTTFHSTASRIYGPVECNSQLKQLATVRPEAEVYGLSWPRQYSVYKKWENSPDQRDEMLTYDNITGLHKCAGKH